MKSMQWSVVLWAAALLCGCGRPARNLTTRVTVPPIPPQQVMATACSVLEQMHFHIDKADPNQGYILTAPLPGAQWFEFWRQDNIGWEAALEANLQSLRRTVELHLIPTDSSARLTCRVKVERLSFPNQPIVSSAQAYRMLAAGTPTIQRLQLYDNQRNRMAWLDLGTDRQLATRICHRIEARLSALR